METAAETQLEPSAPVAIIGITPESSAILQQALQSFGLKSCVLTVPSFNSRFSGYILRVDARSTEWLQSIRSSPHHSGAPIIGIAPKGTDVGRLSHLGLNALLIEPLQMTDAMRAVRTTHLLLLHGIRRHVRVPIVLEVTLQMDGAPTIHGLSRDVSYGGMSVATDAGIYPDREVQAAFSLPGGSGLTLQGTVVWRHNPDLIGLRFAFDEQQRAEVRKWIDRYLHSE